MLIVTDLSVALSGYLKRRLTLLCLLGGLLVMGIGFGALAVRTLNPTQIEDLLRFLQGFFQGFEPTRAHSAIFWRALLNNLKTLGICLLLGLSVIGAPGILAIVFLRGFILGFTVGFLVQELSFKGIVFAVLAVFPQNLLYLPMLLITAVSCLSCAWALWRGRLQGEEVRDQMWGCLFLTGLMVLVALSGAIIEGYLTPFLLWPLRGYFP